MSSHYSPGDVFSDVDRLVEALLTKHPTRMFTPSTISRELPQYSEQDVRNALFQETLVQRLVAFVSWRCIECDSPYRYKMSDASPIGRCDACESDQQHDQIVYFRPTEALLKRLPDMEGDYPKKVLAVADETVARMTSSTLQRPEDNVRENDKPWIEKIHDESMQMKSYMKRLAEDKTPKRGISVAIWIAIWSGVLLIAVTTAGFIYEANRESIKAPAATPTATSTPIAKPSPVKPQKG